MRKRKTFIIRSLLTRCYPLKRTTRKNTCKRTRILTTLSFLTPPCLPFRGGVKRWLYLDYNDMAEDNFFDRVYQVVRLIPAGRVTSYGAIANYLGTKGSSRMVGYPMLSPGTVLPIVTAARVVKRHALLTASPDLGGSMMLTMLERERVIAHA